MVKVRKKISAKNFKKTPLSETISASTANWERIKAGKGWVCCGFDLSLSSIAGCAFSYDKITKRDRGPNFTTWRWGKNTHYFDRITDCSRAHQWIEFLLTQLGVMVELDDVFIAVEEPFPLGMVGRMQSSALKQQAEISGAFLAGLLRYGYKNVFQIPANAWRQIVAAELGITIAPQKYNYTENPYQYAPSGKGSGKWRAKEYGLKLGLEDWPDMISTAKLGKIPRPEMSKAKAVQPDDRYDAFAIAQWMRREHGFGEA